MIYSSIVITVEAGVLATAKYISFQKTSDGHIVISEFSRGQFINTDASCYNLPFFEVLVWKCDQINVTINQ